VALRPSDARVRLRISNIAGRVEVVADDGDAEVVVTGGTQVMDHDEQVVEVQPIHPSQAIHVRCPTGTDVMVGTTSGAVKLQGSLGSVSVSSASGRIRVAAAAEVDLRTGSGKIEVDDCTGRCRASTKSGAVIVGSANAAEITTVSGKIRLGLVAGTIDVRTVSGSVTLMSSGAGPISARTLSGSVSISLPAGVHPEVLASDGRWVECRCEAGDDVTIDVASLSGRVKIFPA
jgi:DUF4097 and DUF4098 domain-containing protein YvlB